MKSLPEKGVIDSMVESIKEGRCTRITNNNVVAYAVPSPNPNKYVIRVDIKIEENQQ